MGRYSQDPNEPDWDRFAPTIPFIEGEMQSTTFAWNADKVKWVTRQPEFSTRMKIVGYDYGRSTTIIRIQAESDDLIYRLPIGDLFDILEKSQVVKDEIPEHTYRIHKQGSSYLVKVVL